MSYKYLFIANLAEIARPLIEIMTDQKKKKEEITEDFGLCDRFLISDRDDRILISSWPINKDFLKDTGEIFCFKNILNLHPDRPSVSLCEDIKREKLIRDKVIDLIKNNNLAIYGYAATKEFFDLIEYFKKLGLKFSTPEIPTKKGLVKYFGSKAGFRETYKKEGLDKIAPMPEGYSVQGGKELTKKAEYFYQKGKSFVIKANYGLAGAGSMIFKINKIKKENFKEKIKKEINIRSSWQKGKTVIEEYIPPDFSVCGGSPSVEFLVEKENISYLYSCGMRIIRGGIFRGVEIGKAAVPLWIEETMKKYGLAFSFIIQKAGYRGFFDTDFVNTKNKKIVALEANIRRTGGTHVYEAGIRLLGTDFLKNYYLVSNNLYENDNLKGIKYPELKKRIKEHLYPVNDQKKGIILTMASLLFEGKFGYMVIGKNKKEALEIENKIIISSG